MKTSPISFINPNLMLLGYHLDALKEDINNYFRTPTGRKKATELIESMQKEFEAMKKDFDKLTELA